MFKTRTRKQAFTHMLTAYNAGTLGASKQMAYGDTCMYQVGTSTCIVGSLFNQEQLNSLKRRKLNAEPISIVAERIGVKNIEFVTGLELYELKKLQGLHDDEAGNRIAKALKTTGLYKYLVSELKKLK